MEIAENIVTTFREQMKESAPRWQDYNDVDPQVRFKHVLQSCITQTPNARLILALDEFGGALESYNKNILELRFFSYWKDLLNEVPQLSLLIALPTSSHQLLMT